MDDQQNIYNLRGIKRKVQGESQPALKRIKALDQDVVNKIAAGEIIVAPMHALKEMIENSIDAGATWIEIIVKEGGMKLLQISDNGKGIHVDDLPILCERFTTSKINSFEDLSTISTYGFRGEALASISHIAHLKVTTKTAESSCAFQAIFSNGKLAPPKPGGEAKPRAMAGRKGTQIVVEDLFYNVPQRKKVFRSSSEEYAKILEVVGKYSIHCHEVAISCKKHGENSMGLSVSTSANTKERIGIVYGQGLSKSLVNFTTNNSRLAFSAYGYASKASHHAKKTTILLFVNHRSVELPAIKTAIQRLYSVFLPKGNHPFTYISIEIAPERVDVNVHPTKREVALLNEEEIIDDICSCLRDEISKTDSSRTFLTQSLLSTGSELQSLHSQASSTAIRAKESIKSTDKVLVRTDPNLRKITSMFESASKTTGGKLEYAVVDKSHMQIRLASIKELRGAVRDQLHRGLLEIFATHTWVGVVDTSRRVAAIQSGVRLLLVDYGLVSNEFFYQLGLTDFGNFGSIVFQNPLDIRLLVKSAISLEENSDHSLNLVDAPVKVTEELVKHRDMLLEYLSMEISEDGKLVSIPLLLKGYMPCLGKLPRFILRLGPCVNWRQEKECFKSLLSELASFYTPEQFPNVATEELENPSSDEKIESRRAQLKQSLEHVLFSAFRSRLVPTIGLSKGIIEIADLKGLYRVFERC